MTWGNPTEGVATAAVGTKRSVTRSGAPRPRPPPRLGPRTRQKRRSVWFPRLLRGPARPSRTGRLRYRSFSSGPGLSGSTHRVPVGTLQDPARDKRFRSYSGTCTHPWWASPCPSKSRTSPPDLQVRPTPPPPSTPVALPFHIDLDFHQKIVTPGGPRPTPHKLQGPSTTRHSFVPPLRPSVPTSGPRDPVPRNSKHQTRNRKPQEPKSPVSTSPDASFTEA